MLTPDRYGISPTTQALAEGFGTLWFRALAECSLHYDLTSVLAQDHAMWHRWKENESSHGNNQHKKRYGRRAITEYGDESNSTSYPFTNSVDHGYRSSNSSPMQLYQCADADCEWHVWKYLEILSTRPSSTACGKAIIDWAIEGHTHEFLSQSTYFCGCVARLKFNHSPEESDEESDEVSDEVSDGIADSMDDPKQESPQSTKEDLDLATSSRVFPIIITQDVNPGDSTTFCKTRREQHPYFKRTGRCPVAPVCPHQSPDLSNSKFLKCIVCTRDQTVPDSSTSLEPRQSIETDPQLCFNPWK